MKEILQNKKNILFIILAVVIIAIIILVIISHSNNTKISSKKQEPKAQVQIISDIVETLGKNENGKNYGKVNLNFSSEKPIEKIWLEKTDGTVEVENIGNTQYTKEVEIEYNKTYIASIITTDGQVIQKKVKVDVYPIIYNANNGTGQTIEDVKVLGQDITIKSNEFTAPTGYSFVGWSTGKNSTTIEYNASSTYSQNAGINLYAVWECGGNTSTCKSAYTTQCDGKKSYKSFYCVTTRKWGSCSIQNGHWHTYMCKYCGANKNCSNNYRHSPCEHNKSYSHTIYHPCSHGYNGEHAYCSHNKYATHYFSE